MKSMFHKLTALALGLGVLALAQPASAAFNGTLGFVGSTVVSGGSLATQTSFVFSDITPTTPALTVLTVSGDFATGSPAVPVLTSFSTATLNTLSLVGFTIGNGTYGTFTSIASDGLGNVSEVISQSTNFLDVYFIGTYIGGPAGASAIPASFRISINYSGGDTATVAATLSIPPVTVVPEPASIAMLGMGVVGIGGLAFRRRSAK